VQSFPLKTLALAVCCLSSTALTAGEPAPKATLGWSSLGIPHVQADSDHGLGYGIGYAYARDNLCLLADEVLTVNGERSQWQGKAGQSSQGQDNLTSDVFFKWLNDDVQVQAFWQAQPASMQQRMEGYVEGFNALLAQTPASAQPQLCRNAGWLRPLVKEDLVRLIRRLLVEGGVGRFTAALVAASPPTGHQAAVGSPHKALAQLREFALNHGSNAVAVGGERSENGKGLLLANPHFPWSGGLRFYQLHLTIPGQLDVMGAALPGLPVVNIGFNQHIAWSHTVDTSSHFTLHRLQLDASDPRRYVVDGQSEPLQERRVQVKVRQANGELAAVEHTLFESRFGPVVMIPGLMPWDARQAYALQDANLKNDRVLAQWDAMNKAGSVAELRQAVASYQGIPWVNTLAVDDQGQALYMNGSVVPNVPGPELQQCADPALVKAGLPGLDGSRSACDWQNDKGTRQPGIVASGQLPQLQDRGVLQNANDSAWMTRPATPLTGFSPLISRSDQLLGLRARFALSKIRQWGAQPITPRLLEGLVTSNQVYLAALTLDDVRAYCKAQGDAAIEQACSALQGWDGQAQVNSGLGVAYFQTAMAALDYKTDWRVAFSPKDPVGTPRGIDWQRLDVAQRLHQGLADAGVRLAAVPPNTTWGALHAVKRGAERIALPGGDGKLGTYNAMTTQGDGVHFEVTGGSSYIQLVSFDEHGPVATGLLAMSQSTDPASAHFSDQTHLFGDQQWRPLPFTAMQRRADGGQPAVELR
jgi:acyl-homoserine-lactone acylase